MLYTRTRIWPMHIHLNKKCTSIRTYYTRTLVYKWCTNLCTYYIPACKILYIRSWRTKYSITVINNCTHILHTYLYTCWIRACQCIYIIPARTSTNMCIHVFQEKHLYMLHTALLRTFTTDAQTYTYTWHRGIKGGLVAAGEGLERVQRDHHLH
jgi:hypothetical protein